MQKMTVFGILCIVCSVLLCGIYAYATLLANAVNNMAASVHVTTYDSNDLIYKLLLPTSLLIFVLGIYLITVGYSRKRREMKGRRD